MRRISVFTLAGKEVEVFRGTDSLAGVPEADGKNKGVFEVKFTTPLRINRVKVYLGSKQTPGWNEIDAVGLTDDAGQLRWAASASASSSYADRAETALPAEPAAQPAPPGNRAPIEPVPKAIDTRGAELEARVTQLEVEVLQLKEQVEALQRTALRQPMEKRNLRPNNARPPIAERR